jgi:hypothetical protein
MLKHSASIDKRKVDNPCAPGDVVVACSTYHDYMINPYRTLERFVWRVGIVRTVRRTGRPSRVEWLQGRWDFEPRDKSWNVGVEAFHRYAIAPRAMFADYVTDDVLEAAVAFQDFASIDDIREALRPLTWDKREARRRCQSCAADIVGNDPHAPGCLHGEARCASVCPVDHTVTCDVEGDHGDAHGTVSGLRWGAGWENPHA